MDSVCSNFSTISLADGKEINVDQAIDTSFKDLQDGFNALHSTNRLFIMADSRDEPYEQMRPIHLEILELLAEVGEIVKEIKSINKQIMPKKPRGWSSTDEERMLAEYTKY